MKDYLITVVQLVEAEGAPPPEIVAEASTEEGAWLFTLTESRIGG